jgi:hypothetical protein
MLHRFSQTYPPTGATDGLSTQRALGQFELGVWEVVFREAIQNSWDARQPGSKQIHFGIAAQELSAERKSLVRESFFRDLPDSLGELRDSLDSETPINLLTIWDTGTRGLGGPLRADLASPLGQRTDFVDFVFNSGRRTDRELGGGTYGFGKGVFYKVSAFNTCIIYSQTEVDTKIESRLIVLSLGESFRGNDGKRYTGRHWWGGSVIENAVLPLVGQEARELGLALGIAPESEFETGTSIAILQPVLGPDGLDETIDILLEASYTWAWPHMLENQEGPSILFSFSVNGVQRQMEHPKSRTDLAPFIELYDYLISYRASGKFDSKSPFDRLHRIAIRGTPSHTGDLAARISPRDHSTFQEREHEGRVALIRSSRMVVKYHQVAEKSLERVQYGVFVAADDLAVEKIFADSEPVAHDDWKPEPNRGSSSKPVRHTLRDIATVFKIVPSNILVGDSGHQQGMETLSRIFGAILAGSIGTGAELRPRRRPDRGSGDSSLRIRVNSLVGLGWDAQNGVSAIFEIKLLGQVPEASNSSLRLKGVPRVVLESGVLEDPSLSAEISGLSVIRWLDVNGDELQRGPVLELKIPEDYNRSLRIEIAQPRGISVTPEVEWELF